MKKELFKMCLNDDCSISRSFSRVDLENYMERLAWI